MNALATLLATAAITAGTVTAVKKLRKTLRHAPDDVRWLRKRRSTREDGIVIDLQENESGVYSVPPGR
jgi:hypothetical protein